MVIDMSDIIYIAEKAMAVKEQWDTADIWEILDRLGIIYEFTDLGSAKEGLKGYCTSFFGQYYIAVNKNLRPYLQKLIAWHELGHIILSPEKLQNGQFLYDTDVFHSLSRAEIQANYFAAEGMIDDDEFISLLKAGHTTSTAASVLKVPEDFVLYKAEIMNAYGYELNLPDMPASDCLGRDITGTENF